MIPEKHTSEFRDTCAALMMAAPFFATLLLRYRHICDPKVPTACVSLTTLRYNPDWVRSLKPEERLAVMLHEVCHGIYSHVATGIALDRDGLDGQPVDRNLMGIAMDYCVNATVTEARIGKLPECGYVDTVRFPAGMTPEAIYRELLKEAKSQPQEGGKPKPGPMDEHGHADDDAEAEASDAPPAIDDAAIVNAANVARAIGGKVPDSIERLIGDLIKPKHDPYGMIRRFVSTVSAGRDRATMVKLNRRMLTRGIGSPGRDGYSLDRVGICIDTSGSIRDEEIRLFLGNVALILQKYRPKEVRIAWTDTEVRRVDTVKTMSDLDAVRRAGAAGGGGTDIEQAYDKLGRCDCYIMLTDGYTPYTKPPKAPVIWAMTTNKVAPYGTTVSLNP